VFDPTISNNSLSEFTSNEHRNKKHQIISQPFNQLDELSSTLNNDGEPDNSNQNEILYKEQVLSS
jgi:hypothetical protein